MVIKSTKEKRILKRSEIEELTKLSKGITISVLNKLIEKRAIKTEGSSNNIRYIVV